MPRPLVALQLLAVFLVELARSGLATAWLIVRPGPVPEGGLLRIGYANLDARGAAVLGALITLTPGTTTLDVDLERRELLLHLLDPSDPVAVATSIRRRFERPLRSLFPARGGDR